MKVLLIATVLGLFSFNSYAEKCEGINACTNLYTKLTGEKVTIDESISDDMSLAAQDADLTPANAKLEFVNFLNKNVVNVLPKNVLKAGRDGEFLTAPIYVVSAGNIPRMFTKEGLVTFVYHSTKETSKLVNAKTRGLLTRKKNNSERRIVDFPKTKIIAVSDTSENAERIITFIMKADQGVHE